MHARPHELLLPESGLAKETERLLTHYAKWVNYHSRRAENSPVSVIPTVISWYGWKDSRKPSLIPTRSHTSRSFIPKTDQQARARGPANENWLNFIPDFVGRLTGYPKQVIIALAHMVEHLSKFNISSIFRKQTRFKQFMERNHMLLNANTLTNLYVSHVSTFLLH